MGKHSIESIAIMEFTKMMHKMMIVLLAIFVSHNTVQVFASTRNVVGRLEDEQRELADTEYPRKLTRLPKGFFKGYPDNNGRCYPEGERGYFTIVETEYFVPLTNLITYPCSASYLPGLGANPNLLDDIKKTIDMIGEETGAKGCGSKCDIENDIGYPDECLDDDGNEIPEPNECVGGDGILDAKTFEGQSFNEVLTGKDNFFFCNNDTSQGPLGALNAYWDVRASRGKRPSRGTFNACDCEESRIVDGEPVTFELGCTKCIGSVKLEVKRCYNSELEDE